MNEPETCKVDLTKTDTYENYIIPDTDVETCLKVLRTVRNWSLVNENFDADASVILSHAHAKLHDMVKDVQNHEAKDAEA